MFAMWNKQSSFIRTTMLRTLEQNKTVAVYTFGEPHPTRQIDSVAQFYEQYPNHKQS